MTELTHRRVWSITWPMIISSASTPLLGLVDTAVIGQTGDVAALGALALSTIIFNFVFWSLGFLRMGTAGLTAQAAGAKNALDIQAHLARAIMIGGTLGLVIIILQMPLAWSAFHLLESSQEVEDLAQRYFFIRIWSAPATLIIYAYIGWFVGLQKTKWSLALQLWLNGSNIVLDVLFVLGFGWGVAGVATGTLIAEVSTVLIGFVLVYKLAHAQTGQRFNLFHPDLINWPAIRRALRVNTDIFIRTVCLAFAFAWFTAQAAKSGDVILAATYVLVQFLSFSAFFLDGFAFATEGLVGSAIGARDRTRLHTSIKLSTQLAGATALLLSLSFFAVGKPIIYGLTNVPEVRAAALTFLPWAAIFPIMSVWCFQFDGVYVGATRTTDMRNFMCLSLAIYLGAWYALFPIFGNHGLWAAFTLFFIVRGLTLGARYPALVRASIPT